MNPRTRMMLLALGGVAVFGLLAIGYFVAVKPYLERADQVKRQEAEAAAKEEDLEALRFKMKKLKDLQKHSLPADPDAAKSEYKLALDKVLKDSGAHGYTVNYLDGDSNSKTGIPQVDPAFKPKRDDKPADYLAYTYVAYKVDVPKTDLQTAAEVLRRYYSLGLLQQITHLEIRHTAVELEKDIRGVKERADLKLEFTTKAIIVNGAPARRSLLPAPAVYGGVVGAAGMASLEQTPAAARNVNPVPDEFITAMAKGRDYKYLAAKDPFHGKLPDPPPLTGTVSGYVFEDLNDDGVWDEGEKAVSGVSVTLAQMVNGKATSEKRATTDSNGGYKFSGVTPGQGYVVRASSFTYTVGKGIPGSTGGSNAVNAELSGISVPVGAESQNNAFTAMPPVPTKPDYSEFIWYTTRIEKDKGDDHTFEITIKDKINQDEYSLEITQQGEKVTARTTKYTFDNHKIDPAERKKKTIGYDSKGLEISRYTMRNKNDFTVYGVDTDGSLILGERPSGLSAESPKDDKFRPGGGGGRPAPKGALPPADPKGAVIGGLVATAPKAEKFYRWEYGKNLKQIVELSKSEADKAIRRAQTRFTSGGGGASSTDDPKGSEKDKP